MSKKEVLYLGDSKIKINPREFKKETLSLKEYLEKFEQTPSLGFDAFQRLYAALRMFGKEKANKTWKPDRWRWLDFKIDTPEREIGVGPLYGLEVPADGLMTYLEEACINPDEKGRGFLFAGPVSSGKTNLVRIVTHTLNAFGYKPEGAVYTVKFRLGDLDDEALLEREFGGLAEVVCPAHEIPLKMLEAGELKKILKKVNKGLPRWQQINRNMGTICPSCNKIMSVLKHEGKDFRDILEVVSLDPGYEVTSFEVRPKDPKSYNALQIFGGETKLERVQAFISKDDPMVLNYGIGGIIDGPSPQRHIVHFSEMYKGGEDFMNSLLDVIQDRKLMILDRYPVHVDSVFIGTTNLDEYKDLAKLPKIGKWMTSRAVVEPVVNLLVIDDMSDALNKRVFKKLGEDIHVPPHFVRKLLAPMAVMSTIDEPKKMGISRLEKALIYNGEIPHGKEFDFEEQLKQLIDESHVKTITERTEGITNGIPFRWFQNLPMDIKRALKRVPEKNKKQLADPDHPGGCIYMTNIEKVIKDSIKMFDAINDDTRKLLLEEVIPLCYEPREKNSLFIAEMARDVNYALLGTETFTKLATKYVVQAYRDAEGKTTYYDETGVERAIDFDFLEDIEKNIGIVNPRDFRKDCANNVKLRKSDYKQLGEKKKYLDWIAERLLEENPTFRRAIENYAIEHVLPEHVPDVPTYFSSSNEKLVGELKRMGYCNACANIAINIASQLRKRSKKRK